MGVGGEERGIQPCGFLLELSLDWIVLRASENVDDFIGESHVTLIDEPLGRFVRAQPLHDLRNLFSRLSATTGIARAYRVRLTDEPQRFDIAFQNSGGRVLLEALPSPDDGFGEALDSVGGLIAGLADTGGENLLDEAARRARALTGFDRAIVRTADGTRESSRGSFASKWKSDDEMPPMVAEPGASAVPVFPRKAADASITAALLEAPTTAQQEDLRTAGIASALSVPLKLDGEVLGVIECHNRTPVTPSFERHAAVELFAQMLAMRIEIERLKA
jgi:light-regulated signal transduction histidine kinase (bacteriophytochrome)